MLVQRDRKLITSNKYRYLKTTFTFQLWLWNFKLTAILYFELYISHACYSISCVFLTKGLNQNHFSYSSHILLPFYWNLEDDRFRELRVTIFQLKKNCEFSKININCYLNKIEIGNSKFYSSINIYIFWIKIIQSLWFILIGYFGKIGVSTCLHNFSNIFYS